jgi:hypothetical protein
MVSHKQSLWDLRYHIRKDGHAVCVTLLFPCPAKTQYCLQVLCLIVRQQFFKGMLVKSHSVVDICNRDCIIRWKLTRCNTLLFAETAASVQSFPNSLITSANVDRCCRNVSHSWFLNWSNWLFSCKRKHPYGIRAKLWRDYLVFLLYDFSLFIWC